MGINTGILTNAYPLSADRIKELERQVLEDKQSFAYLDENSELCFAMPEGIDGIKDLAWSNAYTLTTNGSTLTKKAYKKTGFDTFLLDKTFTKSDINAVWASSESIYEFDGNIYGLASVEFPTGTPAYHDNIIGSYFFVRISERCFTASELRNSELCFFNRNAIELRPSIRIEDWGSATAVFCEYYSPPVVYVINQDNDPTYPKGTYFLFITGTDADAGTLAKAYTKSISCITTADAL